jgi:ubiquinone/menaquinone biosynthesis C-methylase UbiE
MTLTTEAQAKHFTDIADRYYESQGPRSLARACVESVLDITDSSIVLDSACGPGVVTELLYERGVKPEIQGIDVADGMLRIANSRKQKECWDKVYYQYMDGHKLAFPDATFTHAFSCLGVFLFPRPTEGVAELYRTLKSGGWVCISSWNGTAWDKDLQEAYARLYGNMSTPSFEFTPGFDSPEALCSTLTQAGFKEPQVKKHVLNFSFEKVEDSKQTFNGMFRNFSAPLRAMGDEEIRSLIACYVDFVLDDRFKKTDTGVIVEVSGWVAMAWKP